MEFILETLLQFLGEILLQILAEFLFELGLHSMAEAIKRPLTGNPWLVSLGYALMGLIAGLISLVVFPSILIHSATLQGINLIVSPVLAGLSMTAIGIWRRRHGQLLVNINRFTYGFLFAFCMAIVRYLWGA